MDRAAYIKSHISFPMLGYSEEEYKALPDRERFVLAAAFFCDIVRVREEGAPNSGKFVNFFLKLVGLGSGYPWCAAAVNACFEVAGIFTGPAKGKAAVISWHRWATMLGISISPLKARRGDLLYFVNSNGTGHICIVLSVKDGIAQTIEGNTNSSGSREGDAMLRKTRKLTTKWRCIRWTP